MSGKALTVITSRLPRDAELRATPKGVSVLSFSLPADKGWGDKKKTVWYNCAYFGERATKLAPMLTKGTLVMVWGELDEPRAYEARDKSTKISLGLTVQDVTLMGGGETREGQETKGGLEDEPLPF